MDVSFGVDLFCNFDVDLGYNLGVNFQEFIWLLLHEWLFMALMDGYQCFCVKVFWRFSCLVFHALALNSINLKHNSRFVIRIS